MWMSVETGTVTLHSFVKAYKPDWLAKLLASFQLVVQNKVMPVSVGALLFLTLLWVS